MDLDRYKEDSCYYEGYHRGYRGLSNHLLSGYSEYSAYASYAVDRDKFREAWDMGYADGEGDWFHERCGYRE